MIAGSCLCGAIRYEISGEPEWAHNCHCQRCRKIRGTAFASNLFVPLETFRYTEGEDLLRSYKLPDAERFLCEVRRKAGLPGDYWSASLSFFRYTAESFD